MIFKLRCRGGQLHWRQSKKSPLWKQGRETARIWKQSGKVKKRKSRKKRRKSEEAVVGTARVDRGEEGTTTRSPTRERKRTKRVKVEILF